MHETSLVAELVSECERRAQGQTIARVRVRHASSIEDDTLRAIFAALAADGPFERAVLDTEEFDASMTCDECGYTGVVDHDHVYGHVRVCPSCEAISDDAMAPELELVAVELEAVNPLSELRGHR
jgi:Zn finger protein HypA/HybF involved in hydrogenase expression